MALELLKEEDTTAADFRRFMETRAANEPAWLRLLREKAFARFEANGFPSVKEEDWKYTNVAAVTKANFAPATPNGAAASNIDTLIPAEAQNSTLVQVNGFFRTELSQLAALPSGVEISSFADALASPERAKVVRDHFENSDSDESNGFRALNLSYSEGLLIYIPAGLAIEAPIHLLFVSEGADRPQAAFPRILIVAAPNSSATIIETHTSSAQQVYLTNATIDLQLADGANIKHYKVQRESTAAFHIATTTADLGANANYDTITINLGAALCRHDIDVTMDHEGASCSVDGLYMVDGNQHTDTHSMIDHRQPRCRSHQLYKGILDGSSRAVFNGKVFVRHGAQQTDAHQTNKNLLLSNEAQVDTKPQLEIFADDVKCAHGAAVGQLDEDELFYLESRGINPGLAKNMLTYGFAEEVIEKIPIESIKRQLDEVVLNRLHSDLALNS
jgi:Fe-S cluster assembly protein SufD